VGKYALPSGASADIDTMALLLSESWTVPLATPCPEFPATDTFTGSGAPYAAVPPFRPVTTTVAVLSSGAIVTGNTAESPAAKVPSPA